MLSITLLSTYHLFFKSTMGVQQWNLGCIQDWRLTPSERRHGRRSGVFVVNFGHVSHVGLMFLLSIMVPACYV